jgi:hypothetical protein
MNSSDVQKRRDELAEFSYDYGKRVWDRLSLHRDEVETWAEMHERYRRDARRAGFVEFTDDELSSDFAVSLHAAR